MPPNIMCVSIDSLRADYCSFLGANEQTTPFLSELSEDSTVYESAIAPSIWTLPVHSSIFTGLFPPEHGILTGNERLTNQPTFAEQLQDENYSTKAFYWNQWLDAGEILRGFDTNSPSSPITEKTLKGRVSDKLNSISPKLQEKISQIYYKYYRGTRTGETLNLYNKWRSLEKTLTGKRTNGESDVDAVLAEVSNINDPFCCFLHINEAHWEYKPPNPHHQEFTNRSTPALVKNAVYWQDRVYGTPANRLRTITGDIDPPEIEIETFRDLYRGAIRYCDSLIQKLVDGLKSSGAWEDTVFILFGDHGDSFGESNIFGHHFSMDESLIHVPLLIRDPTGKISPGQVSDPVSLVDIYPTILELANADIPENSGLDLSQNTRNEAFSYYDISNHDYYNKDRVVEKEELPPPIQHTIWRSESERLTHFPISGEYQAVGNSEAELQSLLEEHKNDFKILETGTHEIGNDVEKNLKQMGYLDNG